MSVFISYRHTDFDAAKRIRDVLSRNGIETYMDKFDTESQTTDNITEVITKNVANCTHLLAVMSHSTINSWWVPFEIGEATVLTRRIASYRLGYLEMPEYLQMWPVMFNDNHLRMFIEEYKRERTGTRVAFESTSSGPIEKRASKRDAKSFHDTLKSRIRSGY